MSGAQPSFFTVSRTPTDEEDAPLVVVCKKGPVGIFEHRLALEIGLVVDEVDLNARGRNGGDLDDERVICVVHGQVHARESDDFVELVSAFVDFAKAGGKHPDLTSLLMHPLRKIPAHTAHLRGREKGDNVLRDVQNPCFTHDRCVTERAKTEQKYGIWRKVPSRPLRKNP